MSSEKEDPKDYRELIHKKIDGSLSSHETKIFEKDVMKDHQKKTEYELLKKVHDTTIILRKADVPPNFSKKVIDAIKETPPPPQE